MPTAAAAAYVEQLCRHWAHKLTIERSDAGVRVTLLSGAIVTLAPREAALDVEITAGTSDQLSEAKEVVRRHLDRFAFREAPLAFAWVDA